MIVADDYKSTPLGKVFNVSVKIAGATIGINMIVVDTTSYEVVLRNGFLKKVNATINFNAEKMYIYYRGRRFEIPIDIRKGIYSPMIQESEDEETFFVDWNKQDQELKVKRLQKSVILPTRKHEGDVGFDLTSLKEITLEPRDSTIINTEFSLKIPFGYYEQ